MKGLTIIIVVFLSLGLHAKTPPQNALVASNAIVTQAGKAVLEKGGNAFDAALKMNAMYTAQVSRQWTGFWLLHTKEGRQFVYQGKMPRKTEDFFHDQPSPLSESYHDMQVVTLPPPTLGGVTVLQSLKLLSEYAMAPLSEADHKHLIAEAMLLANCEKKEPKNALSRSTIQALRKRIRMDSTFEKGSLQCSSFLHSTEKSAYYIILDKEGNAIAATLTKEPRENAVTPTFLDLPQGFAILNAGGGVRVPSVILLGILNAEMSPMPKNWMNTPRYYQSPEQKIFYFEPQAFSAELQNALLLRGHVLQEASQTWGDLQGIYWDKENDKVYAATDPRGHGLALVF